MTPGLSKNRPLVLFFPLVLVFEALAAEAITSNAIVVDEYGHLPAGVAYWRDGLFSMYDENPPLARYLIALPAFLSGAEMDYSRVGHVRRWEWDVSNDFRRANQERYLRMFVWGRFVVAALAVACGVIIFRWVERDDGVAAALVCAALWFSDPNVLAHSTIATTDLAATAFGLLATFLFVEFLRRPDMAKATLSGLGLGLALGSKFTMILLIPIWTVMGFVVGARRRDPPDLATGKRLLVQVGLIVGVALLVLNLLYGFRGSPSVLGRLPFISPLLTGIEDPDPGGSLVGNRFWDSGLGGLVIPLPRDFLIGFDSQLFEQQVGRFANLHNDELVDGGFWYSPLKVLLFKFPLGSLLLIGASVIFWGISLRPVRPVEAAVWVPPLALVGFLQSPQPRPELAVERIGSTIFVFRVEPHENSCPVSDQVTVDMLAGCIKELDEDSLTGTP